MDLPPVLRKPGVRRLAVGFGLATTAGVFLGLIGPFGMYLNDDVPIRVAYSVATFWLGSLLFSLAIPAVTRLADEMSIPVWLWGPLTVAVISIPVAAVSRVSALMLWPWLSRYVGVLEWYGQSLVISAAAVGLAVLAQRKLASSPRAPTGAAPPPADRLPPRLGPEVLCLQMEDHYVRVHTPAGSDLVLMAMGQAVAAMGEREGLKVHRSWWVARDAVEAAVPDGRQWKLMLRGGLEAPVSRSNIARLRGAGWI